MRRSLALMSVFLFAACTQTPAATSPSPTTATTVAPTVAATPAPTPTSPIPAIPAAVAVEVPVIYSLTTAAGSVVRPEVAPQTGDASVTGRADKFFGTTLEQILKDKGVENAVVVGSAANGAVLYTTFGLSLRGFTVVVAQDGISAEPEFPITLTRWQLLNQPGFTNAENKPLSKGMVTLSTTDLITFK